MKRIAIKTALGTLLILISAAHSMAAATITELRPIDSVRVWEFFAGDLPLGTLESVNRGPSDFRGTNCLMIEEKLELDFAPIQSAIKVSLENFHYVTEDNYLVGDSMSVIANETSQSLVFFNRGDSIVGMVNKGTKHYLVLPSSPDLKALDNNMVDQMELLFGTKELTIGVSFHDSLFVAQFASKAEFSFQVDSFNLVHIGSYADSAYIIRMISPMVQNIYYSPDGRLLKIEDPIQGFSIVLKDDGESSGGMQSGYSFFKALPIYLFYIFIGLILSLGVIKRFGGRLETYVLLILGAAAFSLIRYIQIPLQSWYAAEYVVPGLEAGGSLYLYFAVQTLFSGLVQETLKLIPIILIFISRPPSKKDMVILGMFCGMGFGILEACAITGTAFQAGLMDFISWSTFERIFAILFHTATGAALGYGVASGWKKTPLVWFITVMVHWCSNFLIVFYQQEMLSMVAFEILIAIYDVVFAALVYMAVKAGLKKEAETPKSI